MRGEERGGERGKAVVSVFTGNPNIRQHNTSREETISFSLFSKAIQIKVIS